MDLSGATAPPLFWHQSHRQASPSFWIFLPRANSLYFFYGITVHCDPPPDFTQLRFPPSTPPMATLSAVSHSSLSSSTHRFGNKRRTNKNNPSNCVIFRLNSFNFSKNSLTPLKASLKDEQNSNSSPSISTSTASVVPETERDKHDSRVSEQSGKEEDEVLNTQDSSEQEEKQQEMDWKTDEEFKKFMGNLSIEAAIKLEKKRADMKLKELDTDTTGNPILGLFNRLVRQSVTMERERLEKAEETFKALDLNKLKSCFGFDTFFATDVRRFGDGGILLGI